MSLQLNNITIEARESDNFINATQLCKAGGKKFNDWCRLDATKELIKTLEQDLNTEQNLVETTRGRYNSGSWIHPALATSLAQWISPLFSVRVSCWIEEWKDFKPENKEKYFKEISNLLPYRSLQLEKEIQNVLQKKLNALAEVETEGSTGRIYRLVNRYGDYRD
jgi:hypothetical protein